MSLFVPNPTWHAPEHEAPGLPRILRAHKKGRVGAHLKLTPTVRREALKLAALGIPFRIVAEACGVSEATIHRWRNLGRGKKAKEPFRSFTREIDRARAQAIVRHVAIVQRAGTRHWQASAWFLERTRPEEFGRRVGLGPASAKNGGKPRRTRYVLEFGVTHGPKGRGGSDSLDEGDGERPVLEGES